MKILTVVLLALCASAYAAPSLTTVTATLQDSSAQVWANATWTTEFSKPAGSNATFNNNGSPITPNQAGTANNSGTFTVVLDDNLVVAPAGSGWRFTICPNASVAACNTITLTITGASMNISGQLNAILTIPVVNSAPIIARAYNDTEVNGSYGTLYINSISNVLKQCIQLFCSGSGWSNITNSTNNPIFTGTLTVPCIKFNFDLTNDTTVCSQAGTGHINILLPTVSGTLALLNSPTFTGTPAAPTASPGTNTTQIATTAFVLANASGGNVSNSGTPLQHQVPVWVDATHILGITPSTAGFVLTSNGASADPTFQAVTAGNVSNSGTPLNHQVAIWTDATHVQGLTPSTSGFVLTSNGTGSDPSFQAAAGGSGFPAQMGTEHSIVFNNSTTLSSGSGNNYPAGLWSHLGGTFSVQSNTAAGSTPPNYKSVTSGGTAGLSSSIAEDAVSQQATFNIFGAYLCYCQTEVGGSHIVWMGMSNILYGNLVSEHPNGALIAIRYSGASDTTYQAYVGTATATFTIVNTGVTVDANFHQFGFVHNALNGVDYYIDGNKVATIASGATGFPTVTTPLYAVGESGLLSNSIDLSLFFHSIRWWTRF